MTISRFFRWIRYFNALNRPVRRPRRSTRLMLERLEDRTVPTTDMWMGTVSNLWNVAGNWSTGVPVAGQDVVINSATNTPVILTGTAANIDSLTSTQSVDLEGTTLTLTGGGSVVTGGLALTNGAALTITGNGLLDVTTNNQVFSSSDGTGAVVFGDTSGNTISVANTLQLMVASGLTIDGEGGTLNGSGSIINQGKVAASTSGDTITITVAGSVTNTGGILEATGGGTLALFSNITGGTITTDTGNSSKVTQNVLTVTGSTISGEFAPNSSGSNELSGVTVSSTGVVDMNGAVERVTAGLTLDGTINIKSDSTLGFGVVVNETETVNSSGSSHTGHIVFDSNTSNRISLDDNVTLTVGAHVVIQGQNGTIGQAVIASPTGTIINDGTIQDDVTGGTLTLNAAVTNSATLQALNGGDLTLSAAIGGAGTITTDTGNGSKVAQNAATITGNTISGEFAPSNSGSNELSAITVSSTGVVDMNSTAEERVTGGLTLNGTISIKGGSFLGFGVTPNEHESVTTTGSGSIVFGDTSNNFISVDVNAALTLGAGITVRGNDGHIGIAEFSSPTGTITVASGAFIQDDVAGGTIHLTAATTNNGILRALNSGTLSLEAAVTGNGTITTDAASQVTQINVGITGNTISGKLAYSNNSNNVLNGVTVSTSGDLVGTGGEEQVTVSLVNNGTVNIDADSFFGFGVTPGEMLAVSGNGSFVLDGNSGNRFAVNNSAQLTLDAGITVTGGNGTIGAAFSGSLGTLINNTTIQENTAGDTLTLSTPTTNDGTIEALSGGTLAITIFTVSGNGTITTDTGNSSKVTQSGATIAGNTIAGEFAPAANSSNMLSGVTVASTGVVDMNTGAGERVTGGLILNGTISIKGNSELGFGVTSNEHESVTTTGSGSIVFGDTSASNLISVDAGAVLTLGAGITVHGDDGHFGAAAFASPTGTITVASGAFIQDDVAGGTIHLTTATTNNGTLRALNGGTLSLEAAVTGNGTITTDAASQVTQNGISITGNMISGKLVYTNNGNNQLASDIITSSGVVTGTNAEERVTVALTDNGTIQLNGGSFFGFGVAAGESITLAGSGTVVFDANTSNSLSLDNGVILTIGPNIVIHGQNGTIGTARFANPTGTIINDGIIKNDVATGNLQLTAVTTNNSTLEAENGANLTIQGAVSGNGTITTDTGSKVTQNAITITGNTIAGELTPTNNNSNVLSGVTVTSTGIVDIIGGVERISGGLTLDGTINIKSASFLGFGVAANETETVNSSGSSHTGHIVFDSNTSNRISLDDNVTLTVGAHIVIQGQNGTIGTAVIASPTGKLINDGTIQADVAGGTLHLNPALTTNNATLQALNGGTLSLDGGTITSTGTLTTDTGNGSQLVQNGATLNGITIAGLLTYLDNSNNELLNVIISSTGMVVGNDAEERVSGSLTLNGTININAGSFFGFGVAANESISVTSSGSGQIVFDSNASNRISLDNNVTLTIGSGVTIRGQNGTIGTAVFASPTGTLINNGTIDDDTGNGTFTINPTSFTNNGTVSTAAGSTVNSTTTFTNFSGTTLTGGTYFEAGTFEFVGANIVTNKANITLDGASSAIHNNQNSANALANFTTNSGTFIIENQSFTMPASFTTNSGLLAAGVGGTLNLNGNIANAGGTIAVQDPTATVNQNGITITGGSINVVAGGEFVPSNSSNNFLSGLSATGNLDLATTPGIELVTNGLTLNGTVQINNSSILDFEGSQTLQGNATIVFGASGAGNRLAIDGNTTLTLGANVVVHGQNGTIGEAVFTGGTSNLINNGTISDDVATGTLTLEPSGSITNNNVLQAINGGTLALDANVANSSTITDGNTVGTSVVSINSSTITQTGPGAINVTADGQLVFDGGGITGGTLTSASTLLFTFSGSNILNGVTTTTTGLDLATDPGVAVFDGGSLTLNGTANINGGGILDFEGTQTLQGNATIVFGASGAGNRLAIDGNTTLTLGANVVVHGQNGTIGEAVFTGGTGNLINNGTISDDVATGTLTLEPSGSITNNNVLQAINGGTLALDANVANSSTITAGNTVGTSVVSINSSTITQTGPGAINVTADGQLVFDGGGITGGTLTSASTLLFTFSGSNILNGVTTTTTGLDLATDPGVAVFDGGSLTLNGTANINGGGILDFEGTQTLLGNATIVFGSSGAGNRLAIDGNTTLTLGANVVVHGQNGTIGEAVFLGGTGNLINNGTISDDVATGTLTLEPSGSITNNNGLQAINGGTLALDANVANSSTITDGNTVGTSVVSINSSTITQTGPGAINVTADGQLVFDGGGITGGTLTSASTLLFTFSGSNILNGVTTTTTGLDLATDPGVAVFDGGSLTLNGTANINGGGILDFEGNQTLLGNATIVFGSSGAGNRLTIDGNTTLTLGANVVVHGQNGTIGEAQFLGGTANLINDGTITDDVSTGTLTVNPSGNFTNNGTIGTAAGGTVNATGTFTNFSGTTLTGGTYTEAGTFAFVGANIVTNMANITLNGTASAILNNQNSASGLANFAANSATGSFTLETGRTLTTPTTAGTFTNAGALTIDATGGASKFTASAAYTQTGGTTTLVSRGTLASSTSTVNFQGGTLQGTGTVTGNVAVTGVGTTVAPGTTSTAGIITIAGNLNMGNGTILTIKLIGPNTTTPVAGTDFDQVSANGTVTLTTPTLNGIRTTSYVPAVGAKFQVVNNTGTAAISGNFNTLTEGSTDTIGGVFFGITYLGGTGNRSAVLTTLAPTNVFVDAIWAGTATGAEPIDDPNPGNIPGGLVFGYDAFSDIQPAINEAASNGTVTIFDGTYGTAVDVNKTLAPFQIAFNPANPSHTTLVTLNGTLALDANAEFDTTTANAVINGQISGANNLTKGGSGTLTLADASNNYTGTTTIDGGILSISADGDLGMAPNSAVANAITLAGGTLDDTVGFTLNSNRGITLGTGGGTIQTDDPNLALTYGGIITGGTGLTKTGISDLTLLNSTTLSVLGTVTVSQSRLFFNSQDAIGTSPVSVAGGATLDYLGTNALALANAVTFASGANVATRQAQLTLPASTVFPTAGTMIFNMDDQTTTTIVVQANDTLTGGLTIQVGGTNTTVGTVDWTGVIGGNGGLTKTQVGNLTLSNANTYSGATQVSQGTLQLGINNALPIASAVTIGDSNGDSGLLDLHGFNQTVTGLNFLAPVATTTALTLGTGILKLNGSLNYGPPGDDFPVIITATGAGHIDLDGAVQNFTIGGNHNTNNGGDVQIDAPIQNGGLFFTGTPSLSQPGVLTLGAVNTYTLGTTVADGQLWTTVAGALPSAGTLTLGTASSATAGSVDLRGNNQTLAGLSLATGNTGGINNIVTSSSGSPTFTIDNSSTFTFGGALTSGLSLVEAGSAAQALTGANTYTGTTTVTSGTLLIDGTTEAASAFTVNGGTLGGNGRIDGTVQVNSGGTVSPGDTGPGALTTGSITFNPGSTYLAELGGTTGGTFDQLAVTGNVQLGGTLDVTLVNGFTPVLGDSFPIVLFVSNSPPTNFAPINLPTLSNLITEEQVNSGNVTVLVAQPITLAPSSPLPPDTVNIPYSQQTITASGGTGPYTLTLSNIVNPANLTISGTGTGTITVNGTPNATGTVTFDVTATDSLGGTSGLTPYSITVNPAPTLSPPTLPGGSLGTLYNQTITATGGTGTNTLTVSNILNPISNLNISGSGTSTITINGTPAVTGTETFDVAATDSLGAASGMIQYSITVSHSNVPILSPSTLPNGEIGIVYDQLITASGGSGTITLATSSVSNPTNLSISGSGTGTITVSGTPNTTGTVSFDVTPTDSNGSHAAQLYSFNVVAGVVLSPSSLPNSEVGVGYNQSITASGGSGTITLNTSDVNNPTNLTISGSGTGTITVTGTPSSTGAISFDVTPTDGIGTGTTTLYSFNVIAGVTLNPTSLPTGEVGVNYNNSITASGGSGAITLNTSNVSNPTNLSITGSGTGTISISGTPNSTGTVSFDVTPTDNIGTGTTTLYSFNVIAGVTLSPTSLPTGEVGVNYSNSITASGGSGAIALNTSNVANPTNLSISGSGTGTITVNGTPSTTGTVSFDVTPTDSIGTGTTTLYSFNVIAGVTLSPTSLPSGEVGIVYNKSITASGGSGAIALNTSDVTNPTNLSISGSGSGTITVSGTPNITGTVSFDVTPTDSIGTGTTTLYSFSVVAGVTLSPTSLPTGEVGVVYNKSITASGGSGAITLTTSSVSNPTNLSINGSGTGTITVSGTPNTTGTVSFDVTPTDSIGTGAATLYSFNVIAGVTLSPTSLPAGEVGIAYTKSITASGGSGAITLTTSDVTNPTNLTISGSSTGTITVSGTPNVTGTVSFDVTPTDTIGAGTTTLYSFSVVAGVVLNPASLPNGQVGVAYSQSITASGGSGTITLNLSSITNTTGLNIGGSGSGTITVSGMPASPGTVSFTVTPTDAIGTGVGKVYSITVVPHSLPTLTPSTLPADTVGVAYNQTITAIDGTGNKTLVLTETNHIAGFIVPSGGTNSLAITGTPTAAGTETFTVTATDMFGGKAVANYSFTVNPAVVINPTSMPGGKTNLTYYQVINALQGTGSKTLVVSNVQHAIAGLTLPASGTNSLTVSGTPTSTGTETFTVTATDAVGGMAVANYSITINAPVTLSPATLPADSINVAYNQTITASNGVGTVNLVVSNIQNAIAGLNVPASGTSSLNITGKPTATGTETFTVTATDSAGNKTIGNYSIAVQNLTIKQSVSSPAQITAGSLVTYAITLSNLGSQALSGVQVTDLLPANTSLYGSSPYSHTLSNGKLTITVGTLAANSSVTLYVVVSVNAKTGSGTALINALSVQDALGGSQNLATNSNTVYTS